jgi:hypothetical protein
MTIEEYVERINKNYNTYSHTKAMLFIDYEMTLLAKLKQVCEVLSRNRNTNIIDPASEFFIEACVAATDLINIKNNVWPTDIIDWSFEDNMIFARIVAINNEGQEEADTCIAFPSNEEKYLEFIARAESEAAERAGIVMSPADVARHKIKQIQEELDDHYSMFKRLYPNEPV